MFIVDAEGKTMKVTIIGFLDIINRPVLFLLKTTFRRLDTVSVLR
jgi:hypothetical protein